MLTRTSMPHISLLDLQLATLGAHYFGTFIPFFRRSSLQLQPHTPTCSLSRWLYKSSVPQKHDHVQEMVCPQFTSCLLLYGAFSLYTPGTALVQVFCSLRRRH